MVKQPTAAHSLRRYKAWVFAVMGAVAIVFVINLLFDRNLKSSSSHSACAGNRADICVSAPSVDLYPAGNEDGVNAHLRSRKDDVQKSIGGQVTRIDGEIVQLRTSSNRTVTVRFPVAIQDWWNKHIGTDYGYTFGTGDTIRVDYVEAAGEQGNVISADQVAFSILAIDPSVPMNKPIQRYPSR